MKKQDRTKYSPIQKVILKKIHTPTQTSNENYYILPIIGVYTSLVHSGDHQRRQEPD